RRITASYSMLSQGGPAEANRPGSWFDLLDDEANYRLSERYDRDRDYWQAQLKDRPELGTLSGKPPARFRRPVSGPGRLPRPLADALRALGHGPGASLTQVITAAVGLYLYRLTGARDLILGVVLPGCSGSRRRHTAGVVSNVLPLRMAIDPRSRF